MIDNELQVRLLHAAKDRTGWKQASSRPKLGEVCLESSVDPNNSLGLVFKIKIGDNHRKFCKYIGSSEVIPPPLTPEEDWDFTSSEVLPYFGTVVTASGTPQVFSLYKYPDDYSVIGLRGKTVARIYQLTLGATESAGETTIALGINQNSYKEIRPGNNITFTGNAEAVPSSTILEISADFNSLDVSDIALAEWRNPDQQVTGDTGAIRIYKIKEVDGKISKSTDFIEINVSSPLSVSYNTTTGVATIGIQDGTTSQKGAVQLLDTYTTGTDGNFDDDTKATTNKAITAAISSLDSQAPTLDDTTSSLDIINTVTETNGIVSSTKKTILAGNKINLVVPTGEDTNAGKIIINHDTVASPTVTQGTQDIPSSYTEGEKETLVITDVTTDGYGHITSYKSEASTNLIAADIKAPVTKTDDTTWNYRETGGDITIGEDTAKIPSLKGNTVVWNQKIYNGNFAINEEWAYQNTTAPVFGTNTLKFTATSQYGGIRTRNAVNIESGHKYYIMFDLSTETAYGKIRVDWWNISKLVIDDNKSGRRTGSVIVGTQSSSTNQYFWVHDYNASNWQEITLYGVMCIDLTKLFGSDFNIEKALLGLTTEVAWSNLTADQLALAAANFEKLFPNSYYPYCKGRLVNLGGYGVKMNQLVKTSELRGGTDNGITFTNNNDGTVSVSGTATAAVFYGVNVGTTPQISGHKYYCTVGNKISVNTSPGITRWWIADISTSQAIYTNSTIYTAANSTTVFSFGIGVNNGNVGSGTLIPQVIDLTLMFGPGSEPTLEEFEAMFPEDYYEYNEGTEMNIFDAIGDKKLGLESTGFNQWDEEWESGNIDSTNGLPTDNPSKIRSKNYIPVFAGADYYFKSPVGLNLFFYDADKNYIGFDTTTMTGNMVYRLPSGAAYLLFSTFDATITTYNHDICINISDPNRNGTYEPYKKDTLDLDWVRNIEYTPDGSSTPEKLFPYGLLSAGSVHDEVTETKAIKRVGAVDLGTLTWERESSAYSFALFRSQSNDAKGAVGNITSNVLCAKYPTINNDAFPISDKVVGIQTGYFYSNTLIIVRDDSYTSAAAFKTAMDGVMLYYELATPVEIPLAEPHQMSYVVDDHGTEQQIPINVSSVINAPFRGTFEYYSNFKDAIRDLFEKIKNQKNPVKGVDDTPQTNGKLAVYDSSETTESSDYAVSTTAISPSSSGNTFILPTVQQVVDYIDDVLSSTLTYKGTVSTWAELPTSGQENGDLWIASAIITHDGNTYYPGTFFIWNSDEGSEPSNPHWDIVASNTTVSDNNPYLWIEDPEDEESHVIGGTQYEVGTINGTTIHVRVPDLPDIAGKQTSGKVLVGNGTGANDATASWRGLKLDETVNNDSNNTPIGGTDTGLLERYDNGSLESPYQWRFADTYALDLVKATNSDASSGKVIVGNYDSTASTHTDKPSWRNLKLDELSYDGTGLVPALGTGFLKRTGTDSWSLTNDTLTWKDETNSPTYTEVTQSTTDKGLTNFIHSYSGVTTIELGSYGTSPNVTKDGFRINIPLLTSNNATVGKVLKGTKTTGVTTLPIWDNLSLEELSEVLDSAGASGYLKRVDNGESATDRYTWEFDPYGGSDVMPYKSNSDGTGDVATSSKTTAEINLLPTAGEKVLARTALREQVGTNSYVYHKISVGALENDSNIVLVLNGNFS